KRAHPLVARCKLVCCLRLPLLTSSASLSGSGERRPCVLMAAPRRRSQRRLSCTQIGGLPMSAIHAAAPAAAPADAAATAVGAPTDHLAQMSDGVQLFYRAWAPPRPSQRALILFHRGHEHSGRWQDFVEALQLTDTWIFAWDQRGHGRSPGA